MIKKLKTYGVYLKQNLLYCALCHVELKTGRDFEGMYCPKCGEIFPLYEEQESKENG